MFQFFKRKKIEIPIVSRYQKTVIAFRDIQTAEMKRVYSSDMTLLSMSPIKKDIISYISLLDRLTIHLSSNAHIGEYLLNDKHEDVLIRDFFVDTEGYAIDPIESTNRLIKSACQFINTYEKKESLTDKDYITEKNLHICYKVIVNLEFIAKILNEITTPEIYVKDFK